MAALAFASSTKKAEVKKEIVYVIFFALLLLLILLNMTINITQYYTGGIAAFGKMYFAVWGCFAPTEVTLVTKSTYIAKIHYATNLVCTAHVEEALWHHYIYVTMAITDTEWHFHRQVAFNLCSTDPVCFRPVALKHCAI